MCVACFVTQNQSEVSDPQEQQFLQKIAQSEGVWDYKVGGLDWATGECGVGMQQR